jgi:Domain of unknown function (DUF5017)
MKYFKTLILAALIAPLFTGCVSDDDTELPPHVQPLLNEGFSVGEDNTVLVTEGWTNYAQTGTAVWKIQIYSGNGYAEFNPYGSGNATNVGWLVSPGVTLEAGNDKILRFDAAQAFVTSAANTLEVFVSTDFSGDVTAATWIPVTAALPNNQTEYYEFIPSGNIDLSAYSGTLHVAFKVTGSGTNTSLDGLYQIDNVIVD